MSHLTCPVCGVALPPRAEGARGRARKFCSRTCNSKAHRESSTKTCAHTDCAQPLRARGMCAKHYKQLHREQTGRSHHRTYDRACETCGAAWQSPRADARFCTAKCKGVFLAQHNLLLCKLSAEHPVMARIAETEMAAKAAADEAKAQRKLARMAEWRTARACRACGADFSPLYSPAQATCSTSCSRSMARQDRRVRVLNAYVEPVNWRIVLKRDGAACYLCGYDTDANDYTRRMGSDGREAFIAGLEYPSLDHVIPLAMGGLHELANARLAHTYCNAIKSDRALDAVAA